VWLAYIGDSKWIVVIHSNCTDSSATAAEFREPGSEAPRVWVWSGAGGDSASPPAAIWRGANRGRRHYKEIVGLGLLGCKAYLAWMHTSPQHKRIQQKMPRHLNQVRYSGSLWNLLQCKVKLESCLHPCHWCHCQQDANVPLGTPVNSIVDTPPRAMEPRALSLPFGRFRKAERAPVSPRRPSRLRAAHQVRPSSFCPRQGKWPRQLPPRLVCLDLSSWLLSPVAAFTSTLPSPHDH